MKNARVSDSGALYREPRTYTRVEPEPSRGTRNNDISAAALRPWEFKENLRFDPSKGGTIEGTIDDAGRPRCIGYTVLRQRVDGYRCDSTAFNAILMRVVWADGGFGAIAVSFWYSS